MTAFVLPFYQHKAAKRARLGDLLIAQGKVQTADLAAALRVQSVTGQRLGKILVESGYISASALRRALIRQCVTRFMIFTLSAALSLGGAAKPSRANTEEFGSDVRQMISFTGLDLLKPESGGSALFGTSEVKSKNIGPFTKWTDMFRRFEKEFHAASNSRAVNQWRTELQPLIGLPLEQKVIQVNKMMNDVAYAPDTQTWGKTDFWATPIEFMESASGDCEDYAIAKYASLRALGVPDNRMRIVILQDTAKNLAHAILAVYADSGVMILDNQAKTVRYDYEISNYKPIYSINREGWWLHKAMQPTVLASR